MSWLEFDYEKMSIVLRRPSEGGTTPIPPEDILIGVDDRTSVPTSYVLCDELGEILCKDEL